MRFPGKELRCFIGFRHGIRIADTIKIRRFRFKFARTGIDHPIDRCIALFRQRFAGNLRDRCIRIAEALCSAVKIIGQRDRFKRCFANHQIAELMQKPAVNA